MDNKQVKKEEDDLHIELKAILVQFIAVHIDHRRFQSVSNQEERRLVKVSPKVGHFFQNNSKNNIESHSVFSGKCPTIKNNLLMTYFDF
jgi:hypothetical protein